MSTSSRPPPIKSRFVSVVSKIFIILASMSTLLLWPSDRQQMSMQGVPLDIPSSLYWVMEHSAWIFHALWLHAIITLLAAIGLLRRHEWGRRLFVGTLSVVVAYQAIFVAMEWWWSSSMPHVMLEAAGVSGESVVGMEGIVWHIRIVSFLFGLSWGALFGWIIKRLCSAPTRREFSLVSALPFTA